MSSIKNTSSAGLGRSRRRDWYALEERHAMLLRGRALALTVIGVAALVLPRGVSTERHLLAAVACAVALVLHAALYLAPRRWPRRLLVAVDAALVVDATLILVLAHLSGGVDGAGLWLLPLLALAVTLGHSSGFGLKALILGGIVMGALYALEEPGAPPVLDTAGPLVLTAAVVLIAAVFNGINERDSQRRLDRFDDKWAASVALTAVAEADAVVAIVRPAFQGLLPGWSVSVGLGGGEAAERSWRDDARVLLEVPLVARDEGGARTMGRLTASRPLPRIGRPTVRRRDMEAVREVAADAGSALARIETVERLEHLSMADPLTGLGNRRAFDEALATEVARASRTGRPVGLVMVDVDHFKRFNDRHGHQAGDAALVAVAAALTRVARRDDHACRLGGEEFALLLPGAGEAAAVAVAERIREGLQTEPPTAGPVTVSMGVASAGADVRADTLLRLADARLYAAKESGRDRVVASPA